MRLEKPAGCALRHMRKLMQKNLPPQCARVPDHDFTAEAIEEDCDQGKEKENVDQHERN